jgi:hypothetical protein
MLKQFSPVRSTRTGTGIRQAKCGAYVITMQQNTSYIYIEQSRHVSMLGGVPVPTAWRVLGLRMEERPPIYGG